MERLRSGTATIIGQEYDISGAIGWTQSPSITRRLQVQALKWLEPLITSGETADLAQARSVVQRWADDNLREDPADSMAWYDHAVSMRTTMLACLVHALPDPDPGLDEVVRAHIAWLSDPSNHVPTGNHGLVNDTALVGAACAIGDAEGVALGRARTAAALRTVITDDGATNEQSPYYAGYVAYVLRTTQQALAACSAEPPLAEFGRLPRLFTFMAHATRPDGHAAMIGDTPDAPIRLWDRDAITGTRAQYAMTQGADGPRPSRRIGQYPKAGYILARSGWGTTRPFADEDYWTLRFGPGTILHGHQDHTSVTLYRRGRQVLVDSGYAEPETALRPYVLSAQAHSMTVVQGLRYQRSTATDLVAKRIRRLDETFAVRDRAFAGVTRTRTVLVAHDRPVMVVVDRSAADRRRTFAQLWHVHPDFRPGRVDATGVRFRSTDRADKVRVIPLTWPGRAAAGVSVVEGQEDPVQGWYSGRPAPVVEFRTRARTQFQVAVIVAAGSRARIRYSFAKIDRDLARLEVTVDGKRLTADIRRSTGWIQRR